MNGKNQCACLFSDFFVAFCFVSFFSIIFWCFSSSEVGANWPTLAQLPLKVLSSARIQWLPVLLPRQYEVPMENSSTISRRSPKRLRRWGEFLIVVQKLE